MRLNVIPVFLIGTLAYSTAAGQPVAERLARAWQRFEGDSQMRSAMASLYVEEAGGGTVVFEKNAYTGLATASTLKVVTAASAYELLGKDFRYTTRLAYDGKIEKGMLRGNLYVIGSGDPSLGSWRWKETGTDSVMARMARAVRSQGIRTYSGLSIVAPGWNEEAIPDGWTWNDIGQYYGAGSTGLTWHENQFDMKLQPGTKAGDSIRLLEAKPDPVQPVRIAAVTGAAGSGDDSYLYHAIGISGASWGMGPTLRGSIGAGKVITVSGSLPNPVATFAQEFRLQLRNTAQQSGGPLMAPTADTAKMTVFYRGQSPPLDSLVYWFLRRSINLYGEAFLKTIALEQSTSASTVKGAQLVRDFWKEKGIDPVELRLRDGSGLSPETRVTTHAQVQVLQYARKQSWFGGYYTGFPVYNDMKMKSGTISAVKGFCGFHKSKDGKEYVFSFLVNNYNGRESSIVQKMYAVLNELK
ncbi:D-alanyl-D-alanine carboxypeptidase/D-alanyl-D-alanine-endopeptidase [Flaviaesturariibacter flavus]|uniref:D-alanyl-D-alanine carboxypeptidase/D-alanyl-D-alanine-endopeptidase n=1 Tax=Flaviaesturariibacter flavus TaxID=2502780 RepID=A0A4V2NX29_9BACT|nr:D-alanyl-D-alanine carboxypeptidase/D-alanyl-D-alanine-endopeptidase [Flaviaesturariibacter flavus]TCJ19642.1 D-alanyl-D-alanine carboxypeptidase/D-alanyl-D-alanine-endopeptidase [Flaviaesturariibacter flavus]